MTATHNPLTLMKRAAWPAAGLLVIAYFMGAAIVGENGVMAWGDYRRTKAERGHQLAQLEQEKARLAHRSQLLDPHRADPDLAEELVRRDLGLVRPDEVIIELGDPAASPVRPAAAPRR